MVGQSLSVEEERYEEKVRVCKNYGNKMGWPSVMIGVGTIGSIVFGVTSGVSAGVSAEVGKRILLFLSAGCGGVVFGECLRVAWYSCEACIDYIPIPRFSLREVGEQHNEVAAMNLSEV